MKLSEQITRRHMFVAFGASRQTGTLSAVDLAATRDNASVTLTASDGSVAPISGADASAAGVMTAADKAKLDGLPPTSTRDFATLSDIPAAQVATAITHLRTAGHGAAGDGGGALYKRVGSDPGHGFALQSADGAWWEGVVEGEINPVAVGGGRTATAAQAAFDYAVAIRPSGTITRNIPTIRFEGNWTISSTVLISNPKDITVDATGAYFTTSGDILMFDLNALADPTYATAESSQNFYWKGGRFQCTHGSPTKATAFRMMGFRHCSLEPEHFEGFYRDIITGGKDTIYIGRYKTYNVGHASIEFPPWSVTGGPLQVFIEKVHLSGNAKLLKSYVPLTDSAVRDFSCNLGTSADVDGAIDVEASVLLGVSSISGAFTVGETITGGTSGATMTLAEHYTHDFSFDTAQNEDWLVGTDKSAASFVTGETVTGGTSGATAVIGSDGGYIVQNPAWQNFEVKAAHWESGSGASGAVCVRLRDRIKRGASPSNFKIDMGSCGVNGGSAYGLQISGNIQGISIRGRFAQTSGSGTPIQLHSSLADVKIERNTLFSNAGIDLNGLSRDELDLSDFNVTLQRSRIVTGWAPKALSSVAPNSGTLVDMSADYIDFATVGGLAPRAYEIFVSASDSASSTTDPCRFRAYHPDDTSEPNFLTADLSNVPNGRYQGVLLLVGADSNGDFEYDAAASGAGTLDVVLNVRRMLF